MLSQASLTARTVARSMDEGVLNFAEHLVPLHASMDLPRLVGHVEFLAERAFNAQATVLMLPDETGAFRPSPSMGVRTAANTQARLALGIDAIAKNRRVGLALTDCGLSMRPSITLLSELFELDQVGGANTAIVIPVSFNSELVGVVLFVAEATPVALTLAGILAQHTAVAITQLRQREDVARLHSRDARLWIPDEHYLRLQMAREVSRARRYGRHLGVALVRLENEFVYQSQFGSFLADQILRRMGRLFADGIRDSDILGALDGGFAVIHVETDEAGTEISTRRLVRAAERMVAHRFPELPRPEIAFVIAGFPESADSADALLRQITHPIEVQSQLAA